jgi:hypothetical protein
MASCWPVFLKPILRHPKNLKNLVLAGVVLHNFLSVAVPRYADASYGDCYQNGRLSAFCLSALAPKMSQNDSHAAKDVRDFQRKHFNNECIVPWKEEYFMDYEYKFQVAILTFSCFIAVFKLLQISMAYYEWHIKIQTRRRIKNLLIVRIVFFLCWRARGSPRQSLQHFFLLRILLGMVNH